MPPAKLSRQFRSVIAANDGVFTRSQAIDHGYTDKALRSGIDHGLWQRYGAAGIYLADGFQDTDRSRLRMHLIRAGSRAIVTGPSALQIFGLDLAHAPGIPFSIGAGQSYLSLPRDRHLQLPGAVLLRDRTRPHVTWIDGLPLATRTRAIVDALRVVERHEALTVLHRCLQRHWVSPDELELATTRLHQHRGLTQLRAMANEAAAGSHAESERVMSKLLAAHRISGWVTNLSIFDDGGLIGVGDFVFPQARLVVEVDGRAWHSTPERFQRDRERQNRMGASGQNVCP